jgi:HlyD family secretion protein
MTSLVCVLPFISALFAGCLQEEPLATGYVEGEYVLVAPVETARIESVAVSRGERIVAGEPLAQLERQDAQIAVDGARAALAQAESKLEDLKRGKRPEEIAVVEASLESARAQAREAARVLERRRSLFSTGNVTQAQLDDAKTAADMAEAKLGEIEANLGVMRLPARADEIKAAEAAVEHARADLDNAEWRLAQRTVAQPVNGVVFDILRNPGEIAGPQAPVLSVLPDGAVKLRVFVDEAGRARIAPGTELAVHCDGCRPDLRASVTYVSPDPEFTPPVIYSITTRQKLVYLVEAVPENDGVELRPGQIVDVGLLRGNGYASGSGK